jgi:4-diphosphocytidyl-2-C-methyl-D-erythritol kinase
MSDSVRVQAHAKVNLFLRVLSRETSGFHTLETLFALLELHDTLTVERRPQGITIEVDGADTGPAQQNLAYRAAELVLDATGRQFGVHLHLEKRVPVQAGLGGGSSDGAAALHAVNAMAGNAVPRPEILQFAARLGSDVPFLASGAALAIGWGRGERLFRLPSPGPAPALVAVPREGVATKDAYELLDAWQAREERRGAVVLDAAAFDTWGGIGRLGGNDFENPVFGVRPEFRELFERMAETRPLLVRLSGSGSAIVAIYKSETERDGAALTVGERDQTLIRTAMRAQPAPAPAGSSATAAT